jgi:hypothetical protein
MNLNEENMAISFLKISQALQYKDPKKLINFYHFNFQTHNSVKEPLPSHKNVMKNFKFHSSLQVNSSLLLPMYSSNN